MLSKKRIKIAIFTLLALLLCSSNICLMSQAKKNNVLERLEFEKAEINTSIVDPTKNILRILNASDLNPTVTIKPSKKTLLNAKPVNVDGYLESDNTLSVDLTKLGPANLLPKGIYFITAKRGKQKLQGQFNIVPASLILGKLRIPVPASDETFARVRRYQLTNNADAINDLGFDAEATIIVHDSTSKDIKKPAEGTTPIKVPLNLTIEEDENGNEKLYYTADTFTSIDADVKITGNPIIEAIFKTPLVKGGLPKETSLLSAVPLSKTDPKKNINTESNINPEEDAIAKIVLATNTLIQDKTNLINLNPLDNTIIQLKGLTSGLTQNADSIPESVELLTTAYRALGTGVAKSVSSGIAINDKSLEAEISLNITGIGPLVIKEDSASANNSANIKQLTEKPDPYAVGTVDKDFLPFEVDEKLSLELLEKTGGLPIGSIKAITDGQNPVQLIKEEKQIAFELQEEKSINEILSIRNAIQNGTIQGDLNTINKLPLLPGVIVNNIKEITDLAKNEFGNNSSFTIPVYPGAVLNGDKPDFGLFEYYPGAIVLNSELTKIQSIKIISDVSYEGPSISSLAASNDITVIPTALGKFITDGAKVVSLSGFDPAEDKVFVVSASGTTQVPTFLKAFNPSVQGTTFLNSFGMSNFIQNSAASFTNIFGSDAPPQLTNLAGNFTNKPDFLPSAGIKTINDVIGDFQPGQTDLETLFGGGGTNLFGGVKSPKPPVKDPINNPSDAQPSTGGGNNNTCPQNCVEKTNTNTCEILNYVESGNCCCPLTNNTGNDQGNDNNNNNPTITNCPQDCTIKPLPDTGLTCGTYNQNEVNGCCCPKDNAVKSCPTGCASVSSSITTCPSNQTKIDNCCCPKDSTPATGGGGDTSKSCASGCSKNNATTSCLEQGYQQGINNCCCSGGGNITCPIACVVKIGGTCKVPYPFISGECCCAQQQQGNATNGSAAGTGALRSKNK